MKTKDRKEFEKQDSFEIGAPNDGFAEYFTGQSYLKPLTEPGKTPGAVITIPPEVTHWHGAKSDSWFSHIAVEVPGENTKNEWCEPVSDEEYDKLK